MLGYLRFTLAILVSLNHLWIIYGVGRLAVFSFYVISGYLMTAIIRDTYGTTAPGIKRYIANRLLRIYPSYLIVFLTFAVVFLFFDRSELMRLDSNISSPSTALDWFRNTTLFGLDFSVRDRTVPPSWTLFVELAYYALIPLLLALHPRTLFLWLIAAVAYHAYVVYGASPSDASVAWEARYGNVAAGALGFAIGACTRLYLPEFLKTKRAFVTSSVIFAACYGLSAYWSLTGMKPEVQRILSTLGYYGVMLSAAPMVDYLARMPKSKISEHFGEYSYPFYLVHIPIGFLAFWLLSAEHKSVSTLIAGVTLSLAASWGLVAIDRKISLARTNIRKASLSAKQHEERAVARLSSE
ncbi:acyltransferase family protein [Pseudomonas syringae]|uniref:acyltransferase family protein n=1 Tax=Pseudomonas syringae TaxID=317 RepID=UPI003F75457E